MKQAQVLTEKDTKRVLALDPLIAKGGLAAAAAKAWDGADATSRMHVAHAGRSSYLEARSLAGGASRKSRSWVPSRRSPIVLRKQIG